MILNGKIKNINGHYQIVFQDQLNADKGLVQFEDCEITVDIKKRDGTRTEKQNNSMHLYFTQLANDLNAAGFDMKKVIRKELDIPWTMQSVKDYLWRPVQKAILAKKSTRRLNKMEIDQVYEIVNKVVGERTGIHTPWPCEETLKNMS